ncbi:relaxase/mobilization nuclease domain-containing protein [Enterococcus faecium]|nr:relaxase/mobilization nuclease domain-containing protein [Enterococcus faecium]MCU1831685.1 relaxase/mobilization nuclease domain-containing protein [Enterococcus faecium]MCU1834382.1 relaxase/mobilization nuclease domain-containing protein [Enterococcus faecium]MCU1853065.1 relaxase/mobilization nuclease domain-containing protein [Enterococcus faecium]MCU1878206.1 relaxase/mobilization nuclease domain-containing protein [Enterococcus faecium]
MGATLALKGGKRGASALIGYVNRHGNLDKERIYTHELSAENELAQKQLEATRRIFGKTDGIQAFHWVQSFDDSFDKNNFEDVAKAHEIGKSLVDEIAKSYPNHEIYMGTHTDSKSGYIHNHIVFASIDTQTGKKFHSNSEVGYHLQDLNDRVLLEFGIEQPKEKYKQVDYEMHAEGKMSNREKMKHMILEAQGTASDFTSFKKNLQNDFGVEVYEYNKGKRIGFTWLDDEGKKFTIGGRKLGTDFERPAIERSLELNQQKTLEKTQEVKPKVKYEPDDFSISSLKNHAQQLQKQAEQKKKQDLQRQKEMAQLQHYLHNFDGRGMDRER